MKSHNLYRFLSFFLFILLLGCSDDDTNPNISCKIIKYDKIDFYDIETGETTSDYLNYLFYEGEKLSVREKYGWISDPGTGLSHFGLEFTNKVSYDDQNRINKVEYYANNQTYPAKYDLFIYEGNSSKPSQRNRVENGYTWKEFIQYDSQGRILNTITYWEDDEFPSESTSFIYENGNLKRYTSSKHSYIDGEISEQWIYEYFNYDDKKNPNKLLDFPFVEDRVKQYSENNFRKYTYWQEIPGDGSIGQWEISGYEYDENGYAKTVEFACN